MLHPSQKAGPIIGGVEIYTSAEALSTVQKSPEFNAYHSAISSADLYAKPEDLVAWYPAGGFVARPHETETKKAGIVILAKFIVKDGVENTTKLVEVMGKFCDWVRDNEPGTLTYTVMTRPKAPNEVLMFERYLDLAALGRHGKTAEFKAMS
jgi:quinol monooxygenase YgiN